MKKLHENELYKQAIADIARELPVERGSVLVTGATGLIGSCIVDVFAYANEKLGAQFTVYALGLGKDILEQRFAHLPSVVCIEKNIMEPLEGIEADYIIHAASNADPKSYALHPAETILINVLGAKHVLEMCKSRQTRVLLTSTFEVYGKLDQDEYVESDFGLIDQNQIRSCYPESKRTAEILFRAYHEEYGVNSVIARLSSIYGPTMLKNDSKAHAQFLQKAVNGENVVLKSEGTQKRTYCYVMDAVRGLLTVLFKGEPGEAYNVANDQSIATIAELAQTIAALSGTKVVFDLPDEIENRGFSKPQNCVLKTEKIKALGWSGKYDLKQGLSETLEILREM